MRTLISLTLSLFLLSGFLPKLSALGTTYSTAPTEESSNTTAPNLAMMVMDTVSIQDATIIEGNDTMTVDTLRFVVERQLTTSDFLVWFTSIDSTAQGGFYTGRDGKTDFIPVGDTLRFSATGGSLTDTIKVPVLADMKTELDEYLKVRLVTAGSTVGDQIYIRDSIGIGTIMNNDTSYLSIRDTMLIEGEAGMDSIQFIVNMEGELDTMFTFDFMTMDSTATTAGNDYIGKPSGMATGSGTGVGGFFYGLDTISVLINDDTKVEKDELFKLWASNISAFGRTLLFQNNDSLSIGTIKNDDTARIVINDPMLIEGDVGTDTLKFVVSLDNPVDSLSISYMTMDSTASVATDTDYVAIVLDTIHMHCSTEDTIKVAIKGDQVVEKDELLKIKLIEILPGDRTVYFSDSVGIGTIVNNDTANITIRDTFLVEGNTGIDSLKFVVTTDKLVDSLKVVYTTFDSTAFIADSDYVGVNDTLCITGLTDTIKIAVQSDTKVELNEFMKVSLTEILPSCRRAAFFVDSSAVGEIRNDDTARITIRDTLVVEGDLGTSQLKFVVATDAEVDTMCLVYMTFDSTAFLSDNDYVMASDTLWTSGFGDTIRVNVNGDNKVENEELIKIALKEIISGGRSILFDDSLAIGSIINDDTAYVSIQDTMIVEGNTGTSNICFIASVSNPVDTAFGYTYTTTDSTTNASDYISASGNLNFTDLMDTICVVVNGDVEVELDNYFKLMLSTITAGTRPVYFSDSLAIGTILNDDTGRLSIDDVTHEEGDAGLVTYTFTVTLDSKLDSMLTIDFATCDSTATLANTDYISNTGTLTFAGNANEQETIVISVIGDGIAEIDEIFTVKLSNILAGGLNVIFADSIGTGHIQNDDFDPTIADPCTCLNNASSNAAKDGQFSEVVQVTSQTGETWYITTVSGLYNPPAGTFPPATGGNPYSLITFSTGVAGQKLTEVVLGNGLSHYELNGIHVDDIGYEITVTNGTDILTVGNRCHYETACGADQTIVMPFFPETSGYAKLNSCTANNRFIDDGIHSYQDGSVRYNETTICPNIAGQLLTVSFQVFDLAVGDTLWVYEGQDTTGALIAKGSGNSVSQFNGGWVTSNCDPNINPSGCLTFAFTTNGNNNKGEGWDALVSCSLQGVTTLNRPNDVFATAKCDSLKTRVNLRAPTINGSSSDCAIANDDIIVRYCDVIDTLNAGELSLPVFPFGTYDIHYQLLADTTITTSNRVHVTVPPLVCNDTVITTIGQGCVTMLSPDDLLENPCDTLGGTISQKYSIRVKTDTGYVVGTSPNYPLLDAGKNGNITCNEFYEVTIFRVLEVNANGCMQNSIDSCTGVVKLIDGIRPVFVEVENDTIFGCHDMSLTQSMLSEPTVIDNCEIERLVADIPTNNSGSCEAGKLIEVTWTAYDRCGNSSVAKQNIVILRPEKIDLPKDTILDCGANTLPSLIGWPKIDSDGDGIGDHIITDNNAYCNFELSYEDQTVPGTCGSDYNIIRIFTLFDDCDNVNEAIYVDTQYILLRDTIAPLVNCVDTNAKGGQNNPYSFKTAYNACTALPGNITPPSGTDACDKELTSLITGVFRVSDNRLMANNLTYLSPLEVGAYRVAYVLRDDCGNTSDVCSVYFNIVDQTIPTAICTDELIVSLSYGNLVISAEDIGGGSFDACGIDTILVRRTICGSSTEYETAINSFVAGKFGSDLDANGWSSNIEIGCCDMNTSVKVQLLVFDKGGNYNKCWLTITPDNQPQSVCGDLPDAEGYCNDYATNYIGQSTDTNGNRAYDDNEWQPIAEELVDVINTQFGSPACNAATTVCTNSSIEQEYQLLRDICGIQTMRRRFRTRSFDAQIYPWYYQNITINYRPGWSITFPADTVLQCGATDVGNIPEMLLNINRGTCDQIGWEVKDQVFETEDGSCFKVLREWLVINGCQHSDVQNPFELPRDQIAGKVTENSKRTFSSEEAVFGTALSTQGYFTYTQVIIVMDNEAPIITIAEVDTCIVGVEDAIPFNQADVTPGAAPYECDTLRLFSASGMDCTASNQLDFSYEMFEGGVRIASGAGSSFYQVVQPNRTYSVRFSASDNCGNIGTSERSYTFRDCRRPTALCQSISLNLNIAQSAILTASDINAYSFDNCTDSSDLDLRIWHPALGTGAPTNLTEVLALPTQVNLDCQSIGVTTANLYVIDEAQLYSLCGAQVTLTDNLSACPAGPRAMIAGRIQTLLGDMVEDVEVYVSGTGEMPEMVTTDYNGTFSYDVATGADYMIQPKKDKNPLNGVSTYDLVLIQKHILGLKTFDSPYNYIAADINQSGSVSAYDMVILRQLVLNILTEFPNNESWKFVNMAYPMNGPNPLVKGYQETHSVANINTNVDLEFMAVKVGDINGNARPNAFVASEDRSTVGTFDFHVKDQQVEAGKTYLVDFTAKDLAEMEGYQFTLAYDGLTFEQWEGGFSNENNFGYTFAERGYLTTSWNKQGITDLSQEAVAFKLRFTANENGRLSEMLQINSAFTEAEGYEQDGTLWEVALVFEEALSIDKTFDVYQNRPNPFIKNTQIGFYIPTASQTTLTVMDMAGKIVKTITRHYDKGEHTITLERRDLPATGLLYYQLESSAGKMTKTMLVLD